MNAVKGSFSVRHKCSGCENNLCREGTVQWLCTEGVYCNECWGSAPQKNATGLSRELRSWISDFHHKLHSFPLLEGRLLYFCSWHVEVSELVNPSGQQFTAGSEKAGNSERTISEHYKVWSLALGVGKWMQHFYVRLSGVPKASKGCCSPPVWVFLQSGREKLYTVQVKACAFNNQLIASLIFNLWKKVFLLSGAGFVLEGGCSQAFQFPV